MSAKRSRLELDAIGACYWALDDLSGEDRSLTWVDRQELVAQLRNIVRRGNAKERRRRRAESVANPSPNL